MRFEVRYPSGEAHEVELPGTLAVLGRDPGSDLVLNDVKCSRRHAVVEAGADGLIIRDTDSANGIFVNGRKVERSRLRDGDVVRVGEITLRVLPEPVAGTVVMGPDEMQAMAFEPSPGFAKPAIATLETEPLDPAEAPVRRPAPRGGSTVKAASAAKASPSLPARPADGRAIPRPLTVSLLSALWLLSAVVYVAGAVVALRRPELPPPYGAVAAAVSALLALVAVALGIGLWGMKPWARLLQIVAAVLGLFVCPMTLASATVLVYFLRKGTAVRFRGKDPSLLSEADAAAAADLSAETAFAAAVLAMTALGVVSLALAAFYARPPAS